MKFENVWQESVSLRELLDFVNSSDFDSVDLVFPHVVESVTGFLIAFGALLFPNYRFYTRVCHSTDLDYGKSTYFSVVVALQNCTLTGTPEYSTLKFIFNTVSKTLEYEHASLGSS